MTRGCSCGGLATAALLLTACGSSTVPAAEGGAGGGSTGSKNNCTVYGDPPQKLTQSADAATPAGAACPLLDGEMLDWADANGTPRTACVVVPAGAGTQSPLPMLVWLHPSGFTEDSILITNVGEKTATADVSGDPARPGFILLLPRGRETTHELPAPDNTGWGWDNWYRDVDRDSPGLNVDVAAIDHFIEVVKQRGIVDDKRVYVSGWSNGANMAMLYGFNTPGVAATAIYSGTTPYVDPSDPCPQQPFASNLRPLYLVQHDCDIGGACQAANQDLAQLNKLLPGIQTDHVIINEAQQDVAQCNAVCGPDDPAVNLTLGSANHLQWPLLKTDELLDFLRDHPLP